MLDAGCGSGDVEVEKGWLHLVQGTGRNGGGVEVVQSVVAVVLRW